jgi:hypothetical protein
MAIDSRSCIFEAITVGAAKLSRQCIGLRGIGEWVSVLDSANV